MMQARDESVAGTPIEIILKDNGVSGPKVLCGGRKLSGSLVGQLSYTATASEAVEGRSASWNRSIIQTHVHVVGIYPGTAHRCWTRVNRRGMLAESKCLSAHQLRPLLNFAESSLARQLMLFGIHLNVVLRETS